MERKLFGARFRPCVEDARRQGLRVGVMPKASMEREGNAARTKREQIERNLKRVYDETLNEPVPDKLAELLERLRKKEGR